MPIPPELGKRLIPLKDAAINHFSDENWRELGLITSCLDLIEGHRRLLRSLSFGDEDYPACALEVMLAIVEREVQNFDLVEEYIVQNFDTGGINVSSVMDERAQRIYFQPNAFTVPSHAPRRDLVSVMMPFAPNFDPVFLAIKESAESVGMECSKADDIWEESAVIQDIFGLIYRSFIVVCDFTSRNPNVFYEAGIAHTLGKHVVPITQSADDIPFDLRHHRYVRYLNNNEGRQELKTQVTRRFQHLQGL